MRPTPLVGVGPALPMRITAMAVYVSAHASAARAVTIDARPDTTHARRVGRSRRACGAAGPSGHRGGLGLPDAWTGGASPVGHRGRLGSGAAPERAWRLGPPSTPADGFGRAVRRRARGRGPRTATRTRDPPGDRRGPRAGPATSDEPAPGDRGGAAGRTAGGRRSRDATAAYNGGPAERLGRRRPPRRPTRSRGRDCRGGAAGPGVASRSGGPLLRAAREDSDGEAHRCRRRPPPPPARSADHRRHARAGTRAAGATRLVPGHGARGEIARGAGGHGQPPGRTEDRRRPDTGQALHGGTRIDQAARAGTPSPFPFPLFPGAREPRTRTTTKGRGRWEPRNN